LSYLDFLPSFRVSIECINPQHVPSLPLLLTYLILESANRSCAWTTSLVSSAPGSGLFSWRKAFPTCTDRVYTLTRGN